MFLEIIAPILLAVFFTLLLYYRVLSKMERQKLRRNKIRIPGEHGVFFLLVVLVLINELLLFLMGLLMGTSLSNNTFILYLNMGIAGVTFIMLIHQLLSKRIAVEYLISDEHISSINMQIHRMLKPHQGVYVEMGHSFKMDVDLEKIQSETKWFIEYMKLEKLINKKDIFNQLPESKKEELKATYTCNKPRLENYVNLMLTSTGQHSLDELKNLSVLKEKTEVELKLEQVDMERLKC